MVALIAAIVTRGAAAQGRGPRRPPNPDASRPRAGHHRRPQPPLAAGLSDDRAAQGAGGAEGRHAGAGARANSGSRHERADPVRHHRRRLARGILHPHRPAGAGAVCAHRRDAPRSGKGRGVRQALGDDELSLDRGAGGDEAGLRHPLGAARRASRASDGMPPRSVSRCFARRPPAPTSSRWSRSGGWSRTG